MARSTHISFAPVDHESFESIHNQPIPAAAGGSRRRQVVVGVNDSNASLAALRWAAIEAQRRPTQMIIVHAWSVTPAFGYYPDGILTRREVNHDAGSILDRAVSIARELGLPATGRLIEGHTVDVLVHTAEQADLLVVGHPSHRDMFSAMRHSIASRCARQASCPVVTVPAGVPNPAERNTPATNATRPPNIDATERAAVTSGS